MASASSSSVQPARPAGGFAQAVATSRTSSLPVSLRSAPGRGSSLSAVPDCLPRGAAWCDARRSCPPPRRGQSPRRCCRRPPPAIFGRAAAGGSLAFTQHRGELAAFRLGSVRHDKVHSSRPPVGAPGSPKSKASIWPSSTPSRACSNDRLPRPTCNATSTSAHPRFIRWSSPSSELALSDANPASPEASSYLLPRKICPS
jgi:hypothetical protein